MELVIAGATERTQPPSGSEMKQESASMQMQGEID